jgi:CHAT domain-containing protein/tetratricopeptide (TPR) repeat protein
MPGPFVTRSMVGKGRRGCGLASRMVSWGTNMPVVRNLLLCSLISVVATAPIRAENPRDDERARLTTEASQLAQEASLSMRVGRPAEALKLRRQALALREAAFPKKEFPDGHPEIAVSLHSVAAALEALGQYKEGAVYAERAVQMLQRVYPRDKYPAGHPALAWAYKLAGDLRQELAEPARALDHYTRGLTLVRKVIPATSRDRGKLEGEYLNKIADQHEALGQHAAAATRFLEAHQHFCKLYPAASYPKGHPEIALVLFRLAEVYLADNKPKEAAESAERCIAMLRRIHPVDRYPHGHPNLAGAYRRAGEAREALGEHEKALDHYTHGLNVTRKALKESDPSQGGLVGFYLRKIAAQHEALQQYDAAANRLREAYHHFRKLYPESTYPNGEPSTNYTQNMLGSLYYRTGQFDRAAPWIDDALRMAKTLYPPSRFPKGHSILAIMIFNKGMLLVQQGKVDKGLPYLIEALAMRRRVLTDQKDPVAIDHIITSLNGLASAYQQLGQFKKAQELYDEAEKLRLRIWRGQTSTSAEIQTMRQRAQLAYELGDTQNGLVLELAAVQFTRKLYPKSRYPDGHADLADALLNLGSRMSRMGPAWHTRAVRYFDDAFAMYMRLYPPDKFPRGHPSIALLFLNAGKFQQRQKKYDRALDEIEAAVKMMTRLFPANRYPDGHDLLCSALAALGDLHLEMGHPEKALPIHEQALVMRKDLLTAGISSLSETEAVHMLGELTDYRSRVLASSAGIEEADARIYDTVWQTKASSMRIVQARHLAARLAGVRDPAIQRDWAALLRIRRELSRTRLDTTAAPTDREARLQKLTGQKEDLERSLAQTLHDWSIQVEDDTARCRPRDLLKVLPADAAYIDLFAYNLPRRNDAPRYAAFVLVHGRPIHRVEIEDAEVIDAAIADWRRAITARKTSAAPGVLQRKLWARLSPLLPVGTRTLFISPDGELNRVPWVAIPASRSGRLLLEEYTGGIAIIPHGVFLHTQLTRKRPEKEPPHRILAVASVDYGRRSREPGPITWPALLATADEVRQVRAAAGSRTFILLDKGRATVANVIKALSEGQVTHAHFATHGMFDEEAIREERERTARHRKRNELDLGRNLPIPSASLRSPLSFSALVLAGANDSSRDRLDAGYLTGEAIINLRLEGLRLCVLSACETGLGTLTEGEGLFGLQRALHVAGCWDVVGSLWRVDDAATAALMAKFYHEVWVNHRPHLEALREAQLTIYRHPELIPKLASGQRGRPDYDQAVKVSSSDPITARHSRTSDTKLWAAFVLSGLGK